MFYTQGYAGAATRRYAAVHAGGRIEGASPHALVKILFDELLLAMDAAALAERHGDRAKTSEKQARALSILHALESSLDFDKGGDIAAGLSQIYREARRLLILGAQQRSADEVEQARGIIAEIAEAWNQIG
ncbi:flagellar protein FliS [Sphingobium sp. H39-3-25]|uniref:flagellar export chaperone FliS n=1 Tax=Sphingobium arseniciresistens TaxID=3030834 RepID=UPI0023B9393C|nr:flagellar protein FliS [Sphingobium arseniciresistens]